MNLTDPYLFLDILLRGAVLSGLTILAFAIWNKQGLRQELSGRLAIAFALCFAIYVISTSAIFPNVRSPVRLSLRLLEAPNLVFLWLFLLSVFQDDFRLRSPHLIGGGLYILTMFLERLSEAGLVTLSEIFKLIYFAGSAALIGHAIWVLLQGWAGDLVSERRQSRIFVMAAILLAASLSVIAGNSAEILNETRLQLIGLGAILLTLFLVCKSWLFVQSDLFSSFSEGRHTDKDSSVTLKQQGFLKKLDRAMEDDNLYLDPSLKISALARRIGVGEHSLRHLINQKLGYRNFPAFLNRYRIDFAKAQLKDPALSDKTILSIAMESGFNSLSAFNRAFRQESGTTPRQYRQNPD